MLTPKSYLLVVIVFVLFFGIIYVNSSKKSSLENPDKNAITNPQNLPVEALMSEGTEENPMARLEYEISQLADPATGKIPRGIRQAELDFVKDIPQRQHIVSTRFRTENATWQLRGPWNVGGRTRALGIDVSNENVILAGGVSGGMWRSENGGQSWTKTTQMGELQSVSCLVQDTRQGKTNTWYYGTGEGLGNSAGIVGDGIYKSTNGGRSWQLLPSTSTNTPQSTDNVFDLIYNLAINPANTTQDEVYAACIGAIMRSTDGGATWQPAIDGRINGAIGGNSDVAISNDGKYFYAALSGSRPTGIRGINFSTDGRNWTNITPDGFPVPNNMGRMSIAISPSEPEIVYVLATNLNTPNMKFMLWRASRNADATFTWQNLTANLPSFASRNLDPQDGYNVTIEVKPDNPNVVIVGGTSLYINSNGFSARGDTVQIGGYSTNTNNRTQGLFISGQWNNHHPDQHAIAFYRNPNRFLSAHDGGVSRGEITEANLRNMAWEDISKGYITSQFYTIAINPYTTDDFIMGGMQDNSTFSTNTLNTTTDWTPRWSGDGSFCAVSKDYRYFYVSSQTGALYRADYTSTGSYSRFANIQPTAVADSLYLFINPFALDPNDDKVMYLAGGRRLWRNADLTAIPAVGDMRTSVNWSAVTSVNLFTLAGEKISAIGVSTEPANTVYFGTNGGSLFRVRNAHQNPEAVRLTNPNFPRFGNISCVAVDPRNADRILVVFSNFNVNSLFYSEDAGVTWTTVGGNLEERPDGTGRGPAVRWASILPISANQTIFFVGTSTGLYSATALSTTTRWLQEGRETIGNTPVRMMATRATDFMVAVGTHGNGAYSTRINPDDYGMTGASIFTNANTSFCQGGQITLNAYQSAGNNYQWQRNGVDIPNAPNAPTINASESGRYSLIVRRGNQVANSNNITITILPVPPRPTITVVPPNIDTRLFTLQANTTMTNIQWLRNGQPIFGETSQNFIVREEGRYNVRVTNQSGCSAESDIAGNVTGFGQEASQAEISIYPNPTSDRLYLKIPQSQFVKTTAYIVDMQGKVQMQEIIENNQEIELNVDNLAKGAYLIVFNTKNAMISKKFIKQ